MNYAKIKPLAGRNQSHPAEAATSGGERPCVARKGMLLHSLLLAMPRGLDLMWRNERKGKSALAYRSNCGERMHSQGARDSLRRGCNNLCRCRLKNSAAAK